MESLKKAFESVSKQPFLFVWSSLLFLLMFILFIFAAIGVFLIYFLFLSIFGVELDITSIPTIGVVAVIVMALLLIFNGINAGLSMAYDRALAGEKVSLTRFYSYSLDRAPNAFGIEILRNVIWILTAGPFIAAYIYLLQDYQYMDILIGICVLFVTFIVHLLFTPAQLICGVFGTGIFTSLKKGMDFLRVKHVFFIGSYMLFAVIWLLNFVPFLQIATIFFLYPLSYSSMIVMIKSKIKIQESDM